MSTQIWTHTELVELIEEWKTALKHCASGRSYTIGTRQLTRHSIAEIKEMLRYLTQELDALENGHGPRLVTCRFVRGRR